MKKYLSIFALLLVLCSCGNSGSSGSSDTVSTFIPAPSQTKAESLHGLELPYMYGEKGSIIEHMGYTLSYNEKWRIPNWVAWELLDSELYGDFDRAEKFTPDPQWKGRQAYDSDYTGSGWDRGHMAPSGDMKWSSQTMKECFYLTNVCPQNHNLNSGVWNDLEKLTRKEARYYGCVWVCCGPVVDKGLGTAGKNKVMVPDGFFKALLTRKKDGTYASIGFYFPNEAGNRPLGDYAMSIDELEAFTGMDFFVNLDIKEQEKAEKSYRLKDWNIK
ncbi:MAG: DNA/RNA non-specific endonuclease [Bacteroidales bacterium]|nr:DNA/RNA non-specific endonuclease [Bacteroidales bacterium]